MKKTFWYPIVFMALLTAIFTFILAYMNYSTADRVAANEEYELQAKILYVFDIPIEDDSVEAVDELFSEKITLEDDVFVYQEGDSVEGYAFPVAGAGLWGSIVGYVGISEDYETMLGLTFTQQSETPGLGGRIEDEEFLSQFRGLDISESSEEEYVVYSPAPGANVDAIAGATLTSKSVANFMNDDIHEFLQERRGE
ncbi:FMN-binding protein [Gudongella sp. DL1XJH-153]|uniref:FMN-binding protein n=1 Tax=Gudongella sp. DL1XJH-153 TaxID=3409804 RepID=UPI003BB5391C